MHGAPDDRVDYSSQLKRVALDYRVGSFLQGGSVKIVQSCTFSFK